MKIENRYIFGLVFLLLPLIGCGQYYEDESDDNLVLWYKQSATKWTDAFPLGNGRLAAMDFGGSTLAKFQLNEESLWAGTPSNPRAENYRNNYKKVQDMVLNGERIKAHQFGVENLTARPTSFRSYEPLGDMLITFKDTSSISDYKRSLDLRTAISTVSYTVNGSKFVRESFISTVDDALFIRIKSTGEEKINCTIELQRAKDVRVEALPEGKLLMIGQIVDIEAPEGHDENKGGSGEGGRHMSFAGGLKAKATNGTLRSDGKKLIIQQADEVLIAYTAATNYNLAKLNYDETIDFTGKVQSILERVQHASWQQIKKAHIKAHRAIFGRVKFALGATENDSLPTDERLLAFKNGAVDTGLPVQLFQFGRYMLMCSSGGAAVLPANLQGKWSERMWAPWEADYHLNVNLQMNYWPGDVTNISETFDPLINWFELIAETSRPLAQEMYGSDGWFSHHATNPFGRVTPSASTLSSQFGNAVLDPLPGAWMAISLWDHYEFTQDKDFLRERLYPLLSGASEFILDVLVKDANGDLNFVPSTSPENQYYDPITGEPIRITTNSTYHLAIIKATFKATVEASALLGETDNELFKRISIAEKALPELPIDIKTGRIMEWEKPFEEWDAGHRHLSHLLGLHPFQLISEDTPELYEAARNSLYWREENGHGGMGWAHAHAQLMHARLKDAELAYSSLKTILTMGRGTKSSLMNTIGPFQIDGNLGATAGISEMLIQSHRKDKKGRYILDILPALPKNWASGKISGLLARGAFEVDMEWDHGQLVSMSVTSKNGGSCIVHTKNKTIELKLSKGERKHLTDF